MVVFAMIGSIFLLNFFKSPGSLFRPACWRKEEIEREPSQLSKLI